jgi:hypothetical protein
MSIVERDEASSQLQARDELKSVQLRAVVDHHEDTLAIDDPDTENADEWLTSDCWLDREAMR